MEIKADLKIDLLSHRVTVAWSQVYTISFFFFFFFFSFFFFFLFFFLLAEQLVNREPDGEGGSGFCSAEVMLESFKKRVSTNPPATPKPR
ncbi:unnamed protein product [Pleuronectes platessa]|uniref:Uncharacterized protein n=1 Tax=Pleuronectes platessa TaxID=8262 RepID=A0A9N7V4R2_PLEPL|nr:unnamed protein product [Pleuronectes platessa]